MVLQIGKFTKEGLHKNFSFEVSKNETFQNTFFTDASDDYMITVTEDNAVQGVLSDALSLDQDKIPFRGEKNRLNSGSRKNISHH